MSTTTTNYGLIKPDTTDPILVGQLNDNMDTIDTVLKDHSDKIDAAALGIKYKGEVNYYADLPNSAKIGDAYTVKYAGSSGTTPDGTEYVWGTVSGTNQWINFSKDSYTKAEVDALLALKQNALSSTQLAAVNSGIDSTKVEQIETNKNNISLKANTSDVNAATANLQAQIDALITPTTQDAEIQNARVGADGTSYNTLKARLDAEETALSNNINSLQKDTYEKVALHGNIYQQSGTYINGKHGAGNFALSIHFDVTDIAKVYLNRTTAAYYDIYDFLDGEYNVISFLREGSTSKEYEAELAVPANAKYLVCSGTDVESVTTVYGDKNIALKEDYKKITPIAIRKGFYHQNGTFYENSSYVAEIYDVRNLNFGVVKGKAFQFSSIICKVNKNYEYVSELLGSTNFFNKPNYEVTLSFDGIDYIAISREAGTVSECNAYGNNYYTNQFDAKKVVWLGTSIPAAGLYGKNNEFSYPMIIGRKLGANVINEAVGSSAITCKSPDRVSQSNPYGFTHDFEGASRCLTNTIEEMEWIIEHFDDEDVFDYRTVESLSGSDIAFIKSCSYENKLLPYLTNPEDVDMFVFDHGHNDNTNDEKESYYTESIELTGAEELGWYLAGVKKESENYLCKRYDVSNYNQVIISAQIGPWYDIYDLFDSNGDYLRSVKNLSGVTKTVSDLEIDVSDATSMVISSPTPLLATFEVNALKYDKNNNLYCYQGAMRFLLNKIFEANPKMRVVMIGEYENEKHPDIAKYQEKVAEEWNLPIYKQWNEYGWSNNPISTKWYWNDGIWTLGSANHTITILDCWLADGVHPHSDKSGKTIEFMANHISLWLKNDIFLLEK